MPHEPTTNSRAVGMKYRTPAMPWEADRAVAKRIEKALGDGWALIELSEVSNDIEKLQVTTLAEQQAFKRRRRAKQAEQASNEHYR